ncbi:hypothetical protein FOZ63_017382, partial [Perkinsus olseni]
DAERTEQPILPCPGDEYSAFAEGMEHPAIMEAGVDGEYSSEPQEEDVRGAGGACAVASETTGSSSSPVVNVGGSSQPGELSHSPQPSHQSTSLSASTSSRSSLASSSTPPYQGRRGAAVSQESSSVEQPSTAVNVLAAAAAAAAGTDHSYDCSEEDLAYHRPIAAEISGSSQCSPSTSYGSRPEGAAGMGAMPVEYLVNTPPPLWGDVADDLGEDLSSGIEAAALASAEYLAGFGNKIFSFAQQAVSTPRDAYPPGQVV